MRLFVAVRPPPPAIAHLAAAVSASQPSRADHWHITSAFLGDVQPTEGLYDGLRDAAARRSPFELHLTGGGTFSGARVVWAGVGGDLEQLIGLASDVQDACRNAGVALERRRYRPHLTVGRAGRVDPEVLRGYLGPTWPVQEIELVRSVLGKTAAHTVVERFRLYQA
jgi:2'-5' RNA ligase